MSHHLIHSKQSKEQKDDNSALEDDEENDQPIAVCGLSLKFAQDAVSPETFWKMMVEKRSAMTEFPEDRLNIDAFHDESRSNTICTRGGHFLREDISLFDARFFSISPSEAAAMDPAQRLLLEVTFLALENAGLRLDDIQGSRTSVHTGCFSNDYLQQLLRDGERLPKYAAVGASQSMLANRLSWFFDLRGPSLNLDSACSSSAMAVLQACDLLRQGQTDMGIAAGCNLILDPGYTTILSNMQMLSPDGRSYAFDHRANGYSRGEGFGVVILKRLSDALKTNDHIRAVIRASASNQDGYTPGITQPSGRAQAQLIRETYSTAGLSMKHTRFFEAHGTGTAIGDPVEVGALVDCFQAHRDISSPLYVGAVKTNIGHLEGASGIAGLIKAVLAVESGVIPPNTNFERLNPKLAAYESCVVFPSDCIAWPQCEIRRASINSFGYGGANCHIVIDDAHSYISRHYLQRSCLTAIEAGRGHQTSSPSTLQHLETRANTPHALSLSLNDAPKLLVWSADSGNCAERIISQWGEYCSMHSHDLDFSKIAELAYTLDTRRTFFQWRAYAVVSSSSNLLTLSQIASKPKACTNEIPRLAFVFTGQGSQWYAMGRELLIYPAFLGVVKQAEAYFFKLGCAWSVKDELLKSEQESNIQRPDISQALLSIVEIGLVDVLSFFGVKPVAVVGHSVGEIAAAYCAGLLTQESAFRLLYYRGLYISQIPDKDPMNGAMLVTSVSADGLIPYFELLQAECSEFNLTVSCVNSPVSTTVSGDVSQIERLRQLLENKAIFARRLKVAVAYHSPQMRQIEADCLESFGSLEATHPSSKVKMISSVTGSVLSAERAREGSYWVSNMISPVLFSQALERLCRDSRSSLQKKPDGSHRRAIVVDQLVEIGPHAALRLPIQECLKELPRGQDIGYMSALYRKRPASDTVLHLIGDLYCQGLSVNLRRVNDPDPHCSDSRTCLSDAPGYPFDHSTGYWSESPLSRNYRLRSNSHVELLGSRCLDWNPLEPQWRCVVRISEIPWLLHHRLNGRAIYPASAMIVMAVEAVSQLVDQEHKVNNFILRKVRFLSAIAVESDTTDLETRLRLRPLKLSSDLESQWEFSVFSVSHNHWTENCHGLIQVHYDTEASEIEAQEKSLYYQHCWNATAILCDHEMNSTNVYKNFEGSGFQYGKSHQGITVTRHNQSGKAMTNLDLAKPLELLPVYEQYIIHPASLDSFMQLALVALNGGGTRDMPLQAISAIEKLEISSQGLQPSYSYISACASLESEMPRNKFYSAFGMSEDKESVRLTLSGLETTVVSSVVTTKLDTKSSSWYSIQAMEDVSTLSPNKLVEWLNNLCGTDALGPIEFALDLQAFIYSRMKEMRSHIWKASLKPLKPHLLKYVEWIEWQLGRLDEDPFYNRIDSTLEARLISQGALGTFFVEAADNALGVLQGTVDVLQLLFEKNLIESFYENHSFDSVYYKKLGKYLEGLSWKRPNMNILEVGSGTGSFTQHILSSISFDSTETAARFNSYCYTDVSPAFFERARKRFQNHTHKMTFRTFDAEMDPLAQEFQEEVFDIISASNVLHTTKHLGGTLQRLRKMLKLGGKLILHEIVRPESLAIGFVFGLLPGWWPETQDGRTKSPLISEANWDKLMRSNGFSGVDLALHDYTDKDAHFMSIMCTSAVTFEQAVTPREKVTIAIEADSALQKDLADNLALQLNAQGIHSPQIIYLSTTTEAISLDVLITLFDTETAILSRLNDKLFNALKVLLFSAQRIVWVSNGGGKQASPTFGLINGFAKVFRLENPTAKFATLALENPDKLGMTKDSDRIEDYKEMDGILNIDRIRTDTALKNVMTEKISGEKLLYKSLKDVEPIRVNMQTLDRSTPVFNTKSQVVSKELSPNEIEIEIRAVGLNAVDTLILQGKTSDIEFGRECAGVVSRAGSNSKFLQGDCVCAYGVNMFRSTARTRHELVSHIPEWMPFAEASTLPQDLLVARFLLQVFARLGDHEVILIHGGCSRVAWSVISQIKDACSRLFVTVSSQKYKEVMQRVFGIDNISTAGSFLELFQDRFPEGADVVLDFNHYNVPELVEGASGFGRIISVENGRHATSSSWDSFSLPSNITFVKVNVEEILCIQKLRLRQPQHITSGKSIMKPFFETFQPRSFKLSAVEDAIKVLQNPDYGDGVVIEFNKDDNIPVIEDLQPAYFFDSASTYVIAGGFGDLGSCIAKWMAKRGVRHFILLSRTGPRTDAAKAMVQELESYGATVCAPLCNVAKRPSLEEAIRLCSKTMPKIRGCIQSTAALKDVLYEKMTFEDWNIAVDPKVQGSWNLHELLPKGMDFFILAASITGIVGQPTQINYAAGNTYQDALARYRISIGEKAVSLDLGILQTGGLLSENRDLVDRLMSRNLYYPMSEAEILALFDYVCNPFLDLSQLPAQVVTGIVKPSLHDPRAADFPTTYQHPLWSHNLSESGQKTNLDQPANVGFNITTSLGQARSPAEAAQIVTDALAAQFCRLLSISKAKLNISEPLHRGGADSLSAVDLRNWILKNFAVDIPIFDILGDVPLSTIATTIAKEWQTAQSS